jgi:hypothetical protein
MTTTRSLCLSLELTFEDERVAGRLEDEQGNDWPFSCWLDLLTLIERVQAGVPLPGLREETEMPTQPARLEET